MKIALINNKKQDANVLICILAYVKMTVATYFANSDATQ